MITETYPWLAPAVTALEALWAAGRIPQALLIHGPEGTGRRALAEWVVARCLGTETPPGTGGFQHPDLMTVTLPEDKHQISVGQIRELTTFLNLTSHQGGRKAALLWPAEAMNLAAANGLLKTLEEPAGASTLVLVATAPSRLPATVVSRCQRIRVAAPPAPEAVAWLQRGVGPDGQWPRLLALAGGGPLKARALAAADTGALVARLADDLDQLAAAAESPVAVARRWAREDPAVCLAWLHLELCRRLKEALGAPAGKSPGKMPTAPLQIGQRTVNMAAGFAYLDRLQQARRQLDRSLNMELQLADLLMWWFGATGSAARPRA